MKTRMKNFHCTNDDCLGNFLHEFIPVEEFSFEKKSLETLFKFSNRKKSLRNSFEKTHSRKFQFFV